MVKTFNRGTVSVDYGLDPIFLSLLFFLKKNEEEIGLRSSICRDLILSLC